MPCADRNEKHLYTAMQHAGEFKESSAPLPMSRLFGGNGMAPQVHAFHHKHVRILCFLLCYAVSSQTVNLQSGSLVYAPCYVPDASDPISHISQHRPDITLMNVGPPMASYEGFDLGGHGAIFGQYSTNPPHHTTDSQHYHSPRSLPRIEQYEGFDLEHLVPMVQVRHERDSFL